MEFIIEQQGQFSADILELKEAQKAEAQLWREKYDNLTDAITTVVGMVGKIAQAQERTDEQLGELTAKQADTNDRLNALISVVERQLSQRRNGRSSKSQKPRPNRRTNKPRRKTPSND